MRFCRELGFTGFQNFKLMLAQELATQGQANAPVTGADSVRSPMKTAKVALDQTERLLDRSVLATAAGELLAAAQIEIFGVAASTITAQYLEYKLTRPGLRARAVANAHLATMIAATSVPTMVHILVSSPGSTIDTVRVAELSHLRGARTIIIRTDPRPRLPRRAITWC